MKLKINLLAFATVFFGFSLSADAAPNILFISIDDLRVELGCYGNEYVISPHFDNFAASGMVFENAFCQEAVYTPSRASVFTGKRPESIGVIHLRDDFRKENSDKVTLPQLLRSHGYRTQSIGKTLSPGDSVSWSEPSYRDPNPQNLCGAAPLVVMILSSNE